MICSLSSRADAIARGSDDRLYFVEPCVEKMTMQELFEKLGLNQIFNLLCSIALLSALFGRCF